MHCAGFLWVTWRAVHRAGAGMRSDCDVLHLSIHLLSFCIGQFSQFYYVIVPALLYFGSHDHYCTIDDVNLNAT